MNIHNALNTAIYSRLTGATALTTLLAGSTSCYYQLAPDNSQMNYVVWNFQGGGDSRDSANRKLDIVVFIRAYASNAALAGSIDAQIDNALNMSPLQASGWANFWIAREDNFDGVEIDASGSKTWMAGAFYRIRLDEV